MHWYHPHKHGSSALQLGGGLAGFIEVKNSKYENSYPEWLKDLIASDKKIQFHKIDVDLRSKYEEITPDVNSEDYVLKNQQVHHVNSCPRLSHKWYFASTFSLKIFPPDS
jgi:FtsP/CotA-like multicopper oxidase with cupredoxin domain